MPPQSNKNLYILSGLILLGVVLLLAISLYGIFKPGLSGGIGLTGSSQDYSFFSNMSASVTGELVNISGSVVTVKNKSGQTRDFNASQTTDLSKAEIGKEMIISFIFVNGKLEVSSIFPLATTPGSPPPLPPIPSLQPSLATPSGVVSRENP